MNIQLIRNATMKITYAGCTFLTDPMLSDIGAIRSFAGTAPNPTVALPVEIAQITKDIEAVIVSHTHPDHFDERAGAVLPKDLPFYCQPCDDKVLSQFGFTNVIHVENKQNLRSITLTRTGGQHGNGAIVEKMGSVSGFIFSAEGEPTVYWVGDSVLCDEVIRVLNEYQPDIVITHSGGAVILGFEPILMDAKETLAIFDILPQTRVIAIHMESLDHCTVTRKALRALAVDNSITEDQLFIPCNGECITL